jgi:hypothetical protein
MRAVVRLRARMARQAARLITNPPIGSLIPLPPPVPLTLRLTDAQWSGTGSGLDVDWQWTNSGCD